MIRAIVRPLGSQASLSTHLAGRPKKLIKPNASVFIQFHVRVQCRSQAYRNAANSEGRGCISSLNDLISNVSSTCSTMPSKQKSTSVLRISPRVNKFSKISFYNWQ